MGEFRFRQAGMSFRKVEREAGEQNIEKVASTGEVNLDTKVEKKKKINKGGFCCNRGEVKCI